MNFPINFNVNVRISDLPPGQLMTGTEIVPIVQDGQTRRVTTQDIADLATGGGVVTDASVMYIDPANYGAKGDGIGSNNGVISGAGSDTFSSDSWTFTQADVGKNLWFLSNSVPSTIRTITSVTGDGKAVFTPAHTSGTTGLLWLGGTDDTVALQAALDAARDMQGPDTAETAGNLDGLVMMGGIVQLRPGKAYLVSNSQASYNAGKLSALQISRRTTLTGAGQSFQRASICLLPDSYGHVIANRSPTGGSDSYSDFITISSLNIYGYQSRNPNALDGVFLWTAFSGYDKTDPYNRIYDVSCQRMTRNGFYLRGRAELIVERCLALYNGNYGFFLENINDYKISSCNSGGNTKTGFRLFSAAAGHFIACKSFYNGIGGGTSSSDSANWTIQADQMRNGLTYFTTCEGQESRGSAWYITSGLNVFNGCVGLDPGREGMTTGTLPTVVAGFHLQGDECRLNTFSNCYAGPAIGLFNFTNNWGLATDAVFISATNTSTGVGAQSNKGNINTFTKNMNASGVMEPGTNYRPGYGPIGGGGSTSGANSFLSIDGTFLAKTNPYVVKNLTAFARSTAVDLTWTENLDGGSPITSYIVEYKLNTEPTTWTLFSNAITTLNATVTGLTNNSAYNFRVRAKTAIGEGTNVVVNATPQITVPAQVTGVTATAYPTSVNLTWTAPFDGGSPITDYKVEYKLNTEPTTWTTFADGTSTATSAFVTGLTAGLLYNFRISATNSAGFGATSTPVNATPRATVSAFPSSAVFDLDATQSSSYTSGETIANLIAAPADGSAQSANDWWNGLDGTGTANMTFTGSAGSPSAYFNSSAGINYLTMKAPTTFMRQLQRTDVAIDWWYACAFMRKASANFRVLDTRSQTPLNGVTLDNIAAIDAVVQRGDAGSNSVLSSAAPAVVDDQYVVVIYSHSFSTGKTRIWQNVRTAAEYNQTFLTATVDTPGRVHIFTSKFDFGYVPTGSRWVASSCGNEFLTDAKAATIFDMYVQRHNRPYA